MLRHNEIKGRDAVDLDGKWIGTIKDTWPLDGSGLPELALVKVGRQFGALRYLPLDAAEVHEFNLIRFPVSQHAIEDAPDAEDRRWGDPADLARGHWVTLSE